MRRQKFVSACFIFARKEHVTTESNLPNGQARITQPRTAVPSMLSRYATCLSVDLVWHTDSFFYEVTLVSLLQKKRVYEHGEIECGSVSLMRFKLKRILL
jgi:hypothetical protein